MSPLKALELLIIRHDLLTSRNVCLSIFRSVGVLTRTQEGAVKEGVEMEKSTVTICRRKLNGKLVRNASFKDVERNAMQTE